MEEVFMSRVLSLLQGIQIVAVVITWFVIGIFFQLRKVVKHIEKLER